MKQSFLAFLIYSLFSTSLFADVQLISFSSVEGQKRFSRSTKVDFFPLANQFESQSNSLFCGPTSTTIVLNALRIEKLRKGDLKIAPDQRLLADNDRKFMTSDMQPLFNRYTQNNVLDVKSEIPVKTRSQILGEKSGSKESDWGLQLKQLGDLLKAHGLKVNIRVANEALSENTIRKEVIQNLKEANNFVIVNYARKSLNQVGGGHISPLGAYDRATDSVLILDVNPNRADWVWVKIHDLVAAMQTKDTLENRGYVLVSDAS